VKSELVDQISWVQNLTWKIAKINFDFSFFDISSSLLLHDALWIEIAVDIVLSISEPIHCDPVAQGLDLLPYLRISLLDPCLDALLFLAVGSTVEPTA
jgi:hypothetical protein